MLLTIKKINTPSYVRWSYKMNIGIDDFLVDTKNKDQVAYIFHVADKALHKAELPLATWEKYYELYNLGMHAKIRQKLIKAIY